MIADEKCKAVSVRLLELLSPYGYFCGMVQYENMTWTGNMLYVSTANFTAMAVSKNCYRL